MKNKWGALLLIFLVIGMNSAHVYAESCGLIGSIEERIADCSKLPDSMKENWSLVARTIDAQEIWKQPNKNLLWTDVKSAINGFDGSKACYNKKNKLKMKNFNPIVGKELRLPELLEYMDAYKQNIHRALKGFDKHSYWTSTYLVEEFDHVSRMFNTNFFYQTTVSFDGQNANYNPEAVTTEHGVLTRCVLSY